MKIIRFKEKYFSWLLILQGKTYLILVQYLFVVSACFMTFKDVMAANWNLLPRFAAGVQYSDNLYFTRFDKVSDTNLLIVPAFILRGETDRSLATVEAGISLERYNKVKEADRNDPFIYFDWDHTWERQIFGIGIRYWQDSTRISELEATGRSNIFGTRTNNRINPRWQSIIDESNLIEIGLTLLDVYYDLPTLIDYQDYEAILRWRHEVGPLHSIYLTTAGNKYNAEAIGLDYNYGEILGGITYLRNEMRRYDLSLGVGYADRQMQQNYTTWLINASVTNQREYDELTLLLSSELAPSGSAGLRKISAFDLQYRREMSTNLNFTFHTRFTISEPVIEEFELERNETMTVRPGLSYRLAEDWRIDTWYQYLTRRTTNTESIVENSIYCGFRYDVNLENI